MNEEKRVQERVLTRIAAIVEGEELFHSRGTSVIKVTKDGREQLLEIPIRTAGVSELMEDLAKKAPKPPVKTELVRKDSPEGRALRLTQDRLVRIFDLTDEAYTATLAEHERRFVWAVVIQALDVEFKDAEGRPVQDPERKKAVLESSGLTNEHLARILKDVRRLTRLAEEEEDFLSASASA